MSAHFYCYKCNKKVELKITEENVEKYRIGKHLFCLDCKSKKEAEE